MYSLNRIVLVIAIGLTALSFDSARAAIIVNGGFESALTAWTTVNQAGGEGSFSIQTGTTSPIFGATVPSPAEGLASAMADSGGPGSHVLYQDFVVPTLNAGETGFLFRASVYIANGADRFATPSSLQFDLPASGAAGFNQRARIDITLAGATDPFSMATSDLVHNIFETRVGDPLISGYNTISADLSAALAGRAGQTLRLRIAEVDNLGPFQFGIDRVEISAVPEPRTSIMLIASLATIALLMNGRVSKLGFRSGCDEPVSSSTCP
jgi:hypothetical protein